ncbi:MAG TPA: hypothetical protein DCR14_15155, partial [Acidimicrobiaceae bacterium]|nr:hypothetical protein [Acidimicrobiaceae bacterium]
MAIDDGTLYVLSATGVATIDAASVASCAVDVAAAAPAAFTWGGAASHIDALGDRMAFGGPSGGALAIADRADVIECASFVGDLAMTGPSQVFAITAAGVESVDVGGGTCTSTVEVQAGALAARH